MRALLRLRLYSVGRQVNDSLTRLMPRERARIGRMMALYGMFISPGQVVFDVGANVGNRTALFVRLGARVVAAEPQSVCVHHLRKRFGSNASVSIVAMAVGRTAGTAEMHVSQAHVISSLSPDWLASVQGTRRFGVHGWDQTETVTVTTLDALIQQYGAPAFCKLDVEGFESEVLAGLSRTVPALSFEYTPEYAANTTRCVARLSELGNYEYNYDVGEAMKLELPKWVGPDEIGDAVRSVSHSTFADIYARLRRA